MFYSFVDAGMISEEDTFRPMEMSEDKLLAVHSKEYLQSLTVSTGMQSFIFCFYHYSLQFTYRFLKVTFDKECVAIVIRLLLSIGFQIMINHDLYQGLADQSDQSDQSHQSDHRQTMRTDPNPRSAESQLWQTIICLRGEIILRLY